MRRSSMCWRTLRKYQTKSERTLRQHVARIRETRTLHPDILSGTKTGTRQSQRGGHRRLVPHFLHQLVSVPRHLSKYTCSKVQIPSFRNSATSFRNLHEHNEDPNKTAYVNVIIDTIISTGRADDFIIAIANVIQRLAIDQLHILGRYLRQRTWRTYHHGYHGQIP